MVDNETVQETLNGVYINIPHNPSKVVVVTLDGLAVAEVYTLDDKIIYEPELPDVEGNYLAPISAAILSLGERVSNELHNQDLKIGCIGTSEGIILSVLIGDSLLSINWMDGMTVETLSQSWDKLQQAIQPLRDLLE